MKRVIEKYVVNELAKEVLAGGYKAGDTVYVNTDKDGLTFSKTKNTENGEMPDTSKDKERKKTRRSRAKAKKNVDELNKATKNVQEAVKEIKKEEK